MLSVLFPASTISNLISSPTISTSTEMRNSLLGSLDDDEGGFMLGNFNVTSLPFGTKFVVCKIDVSFEDENESGGSDDSIGDLGGIYSEANLIADWRKPLKGILARDLNMLSSWGTMIKGEPVYKASI